MNVARMIPVLTGLTVVCGILSVSPSRALSQGSNDELAVAESDAAERAERARFYFGLYGGAGYFTEQVVHVYGNYRSSSGPYAEIGIEPGVTWGRNALHAWITYQGPIGDQNYASGRFYNNMEAQPNLQRATVKTVGAATFGLGYTYLCDRTPLYGSARLGYTRSSRTENLTAPYVTDVEWRKGVAAEVLFGARLRFAKRGSLGLGLAAGYRMTFVDGRTFQGVYVGPRITMMLE